LVGRVDAADVVWQAVAARTRPPVLTHVLVPAHLDSVGNPGRCCFVLLGCLFEVLSAPQVQVSL